jgi:hypothetical protein
MRVAAIALLLAAPAMSAPAAHACSTHETHHAFWASPPATLNPDEVVLKVKYSTHAEPAPAAGFRTTCDGDGVILDVVEVMQGSFAGQRIALIPPVIGSFAVDFEQGQPLFVVGKIGEHHRFSERYVYRPNTEGRAYRNINFVPDAWPEPAGGPLSAPVLVYREPLHVVLARRLRDMVTAADNKLYALFSLVRW